MEGRGEKVVLYLALLLCLIIIFGSCNSSGTITPEEKRHLRDKTVEMFNHAYSAYMDKAYPADELMPLSCKGRFRGSEPSRGDIDDTLGNFTLTLIDSLDTLAVFGHITKFEEAVRLVMRDARFDADTVVSVFETNIRILGGLLGGHVAAIFFKTKGKGMDWYRNELLAMAKEVGDRLLPAFNTTTGIPYPRINLKHGITPRLASATRDTCTSCAGTMILEFAALSRLTGIAVYEEKAHKAMDYLWSQRHRTSDLMGTVINLHNGDWIRRESGVGAGIDSYYEYVLKAYVLLGDDTYLARFNKHYDAVKKYVRQGPLLVDVHMHKPTSASRNFMDALLAFWPGLQVMFGDIGSAVETHEMLYQVVQRHNFLPEAFTTDFRVHWAQHPLRPEFLESTYFLYEATWDPYYLEVGKKVLNNLEEYARVECGFAAIKDLKKGTLEDQMDSYVLAETFKYLFLLFSDKEDVVLDIDSFVFTTEAHLLPLSLSVGNYSWKAPPKTTPDIYKFDMMSVAEMTQAADDDVSVYESSEDEEEEVEESVSKPGTCRNYQVTVPGGYAFVHGIRAQLRDLVDNTHPKFEKDRPRLKATDFVAGNKDHMEMLHHMGIRISTMPDGRIQLLHTAADALSQMYAEAGLQFMQEMIELSKLQKQDSQHDPMYVKLMSRPFDGEKAYRAGPAQFGYNLSGNPPVMGKLVVATPLKACNNADIVNGAELAGKIAILERGDCMFVEKARNIQKSGAIGGIVLDSSQGSSSDNLSLFAMSGDGTHDVHIPMVFLFHQQGQELLANLKDNPDLEVELTCQEMEDEDNVSPILTNVKQSSESDPSPPVGAGATQSPNAPRSSQHQMPSTRVTHGSSPSVAETTVPLSKAEHGFYHTDFLDISTNQYFLQAGTKFFNLNIEITMHDDTLPIENRRRLKLEPLPDYSRMLTFYIHYASTPGAKRERPILNEIYLDIIHCLQRDTNLETLPQSANYMRAVARFLESAYMGLDRIDLSALELMQDLATKLLVKKFYPKGQSVYVKENPHLAAGPMTENPGVKGKTKGAGGGVKISVRTGEDGSYTAFVEKGDTGRHPREMSGELPGQQFDPNLPRGPDGQFGGANQHDVRRPENDGMSSGQRSVGTGSGAGMGQQDVASAKSIGDKMAQDLSIPPSKTDREQLFGEQPHDSQASEDHISSSSFHSSSSESSLPSSSPTSDTSSPSSSSSSSLSSSSLSSTDDVKDEL